MAGDGCRKHGCTYSVRLIPCPDYGLYDFVLGHDVALHIENGRSDMCTYRIICKAAVIGGGSLLGLVLASAAAAQAYPQKAIRIVGAVPAWPGSDLLARTIGQKFTETWVGGGGRQRPGANGAIAFELVAKANPDGYTCCLLPIRAVINPSLYRSSRTIVQKSSRRLSILLKRQ